MAPGASPANSYVPGTPTLEQGGGPDNRYAAARSNGRGGIAATTDPSAIRRNDWAAEGKGPQRRSLLHCTRKCVTGVPDGIRGLFDVTPLPFIPFSDTGGEALSNNGVVA